MDCFSLEAFQNGLDSDNQVLSVKALEQAAEAFESKSSFLSDYILSSPNCAEVFDRWRENVDLKDSEIGVCYCRFFAKLIGSLNEVKSLPVCGRVVHTQMKRIHMNLGSDNDELVCVTLELMKAIVSSGLKAAKDFHDEFFGVNRKQKFNSRNFQKLFGRKRRKEPHFDIQKNLILFIDSLMKCGHSDALRTVVDSFGPVGLLLKHLSLFPAHLVEQTMSLIFKSILINKDITKSRKYRLFDTNVADRLIDLYDTQDEQILRLIHGFMRSLIIDEGSSLWVFPEDMPSENVCDAWNSTSKVIFRILSKLKPASSPFQQSLFFEILEKYPLISMQFVQKFPHSLVPRTEARFYQNVEWLIRAMSVPVPSSDRMRVLFQMNGSFVLKNSLDVVIPSKINRNTFIQGMQHSSSSVQAVSMMLLHACVRRFEKLKDILVEFGWKERKLVDCFAARIPSDESIQSLVQTANPFSLSGQSSFPASLTPKVFAAGIDYLAVCKKLGISSGKSSMSSIFGHLRNYCHKWGVNGLFVTQEAASRLRFAILPLLDVLTNNGPELWRGSKDLGGDCILLWLLKLLCVVYHNSSESGDLEERVLALLKSVFPNDNVGDLISWMSAIRGSTVACELLVRTAVSLQKNDELWKRAHGSSIPAALLNSQNAAEFCVCKRLVAGVSEDLKQICVSVLAEQSKTTTDGDILAAVFVVLGSISENSFGNRPVKLVANVAKTELIAVLREIAKTRSEEKKHGVEEKQLYSFSTDGDQDSDIGESMDSIWKLCKLSPCPSPQRALQPMLENRLVSIMISSPVSVVVHQLPKLHKLHTESALKSWVGSLDIDFFEGRPSLIEELDPWECGHLLGIPSLADTLVNVLCKRAISMLEHTNSQTALWESYYKRWELFLVSSIRNQCKKNLNIYLDLLISLAGHEIGMELCKFLLIPVLTEIGCSFEQTLLQTLFSKIPALPISSQIYLLQWMKLFAMNDDFFTKHQYTVLHSGFHLLGDIRGAEIMDVMMQKCGGKDMETAQQLCQILRCSKSIIPHLAPSTMACLLRFMDTTCNPVFVECAGELLSSIPKLRESTFISKKSLFRVWKIVSEETAVFLRCLVDCNSDTMLEVLEADESVSLNNCVVGCELLKFFDRFGSRHQTIVLNAVSSALTSAMQSDPCPTILCKSLRCLLDAGDEVCDVIEKAANLLSTSPSIPSVFLGPNFSDIVPVIIGKSSIHFKIAVEGILSVLRKSLTQDELPGMKTLLAIVKSDVSSAFLPSCASHITDFCECVSFEILKKHPDVAHLLALITLVFEETSCLESLEPLDILLDPSIAEMMENVVGIIGTQDEADHLECVQSELWFLVVLRGILKRNADFVCSMQLLYAMLRCFGGSVNGKDWLLRQCLAISGKAGFSPDMYDYSFGKSIVKVHKQKQQRTLHYGRSQWFFNHINIQKLRSTIHDFPSNEEHIEFQNTLSNENVIEECESSKQKLVGLMDETDSRYKSQDVSGRYDPCYLLSSMRYFADEDSLYAGPLCYNGLLGFVVVCMSSAVEKTRKLAYDVISQALDLMEKAVENKRPRGAAQIHNLLLCLKNAIPSAFAKLPFILTCFVAEAVSVLLKPTHFLYKPLNAFLLSRPALDLNDVPLFYSSFQSGCMTLKADRLWILRLLKQGIQSNDDAEIYIHRFVFSLLMSFFDSELNDTYSRQLVVSILVRACRTERGWIHIQRHTPFLSWVTMHVNDDSTPVMFIIGFMKAIEGGCHTTKSDIVAPIPFEAEFNPILKAMVNRIQLEINANLTLQFMSLYSCLYEMSPMKGKLFIPPLNLVEDLISNHESLLSTHLGTIQSFSKCILKAHATKFPHLKVENSSLKKLRSLSS